MQGLRATATAHGDAATLGSPWTGVRVPARRSFQAKSNIPIALVQMALPPGGVRRQDLLRGAGTPRAQGACDAAPQAITRQLRQD
jgi:hypothetical protein